MRTGTIIGLLLIFTGLIGCSSDDETTLPTVEVRQAQRIKDIKDHLKAPSEGWVLSYRPVPGAGAYFILLKFNEDGTVRIQTDLVADDGAYYDQTIPYRIDIAHDEELIFETYAAFHYLFELNQATFGGEFEFFVSSYSEDAIVLISKNDVSNPRTVVTMTPADASDADRFSRELASNFNAFSSNVPRLFGGVGISQQIFLEDHNYSIFWRLDLDRRVVTFDFAGTGQTAQDVFDATDYQLLNEDIPFIFLDGKLVLEDDISIGAHVISSITPMNFDPSNGQSLCPGSGIGTPTYMATAPDIGAITISKTLYSGLSEGFEPVTSTFFAVNIPFIFDSTFVSLAEGGSISERLPEAQGFMITYGWEDEGGVAPANAVGFIMETESDSSYFFLRQAEIMQTGNQLTFNLLPGTYSGYDQTTPEQEQALIDITDEIFEGGILYVYALNIQNLVAFQLYNPCNGYELVLVR